MARVLGHRQTKEAATDNPNLMSPRHIPTLQGHQAFPGHQETFGQIKSLPQSCRWAPLANRLEVA